MLNRQQVLKLAEEATKLADWMQVHAFASQVYGENKAVKVRIETYEEYDDENYGYPIGDITAYDVNGNTISPDYALPFFQTEEWQEASKGYEDNDEDSEYGPSTFVEKLRDIPNLTRKQNWPWLHINDLPSNDKTYDLTITPSLTLPTQEVAS
jgi:hypothetical protein